MKRFILFFGLFLHFGLSIAQITVTGTRQGYCSGACCQYGVDYVIQINGDSDTLEKMELDHAMIENVRFDVSLITTLTQDSSGQSTLQMQFSVRSKPGDDREIFLWIDSEKEMEPNYLILNYRKKKLRLPIAALKEIPPIPYP